MRYPSINSDGTARIGRPPGPSKNRGVRDWDRHDPVVLKYVAANPDMKRYKIAKFLKMSPSSLSNTTSPPECVAELERLKALPPGELSDFIIDEGV